MLFQHTGSTGCANPAHAPYNPFLDHRFLAALEALDGGPKAAND